MRKKTNPVAKSMAINRRRTQYVPNKKKHYAQWLEDEMDYMPSEYVPDEEQEEDDGYTEA